MSGLSDEALDILSSHPWEESIPRLVQHAIGKMKRLYWQGVFGGPTPGGVEAQDLVLGSIKKVLDGTRAWDPHSQPDLFLYLKSVIDSEVNHLADSWENQHVFREATLSGKLDDEGNVAEFWNLLDCPNTDPEVALLEKERERLSEEFFWAFYEFLEGTPLLQTILECIAEGLDKRSEIAGKMGISVKEFDNLKKQLQRRLKSFQDQQMERL